MTRGSLLSDKISQGGVTQEGEQVMGRLDHMLPQPLYLMCQAIGQAKSLGRKGSTQPKALLDRTTGSEPELACVVLAI